MRITVGDEIPIRLLLEALSSQNFTLVEDGIGGFILRSIPDIIRTAPTSVSDATEENIEKLNARIRY